MKQFVIYVLEVIFLPVTLVLLVVEWFKFKKYIKIMSKVINTNDEFYRYLEKLEFRTDWLNRLYTVQPIPKAFRDFNDDELYDVTMRSLLPMMKMIEKNVLVDVCSVIISRIDEESYIVCITPYNFPKFRTLLTVSIISVFLYFIAALSYIIFI